MAMEHIFFDLDRTLWDFETNSHHTLLELIDEFQLVSKGIDSPEDFILRYKINNEKLWSLYRNGKISKQELRGKRFLITLEEYGISNKALANKIGKGYVEQSPLKTVLFPFTIQVLDYLSKKYQLHIITNGFKEVQFIKLKASKLDKYFNVVLTSEQVGVKKPDSRIFRFALDQAKAHVSKSIMIGDDLFVDILGAQEIGMESIYFNPEKTHHAQDIRYEISCLSELMELL